MRVSEFLYPESITRCQHIKVNGVQCGSPSLKNKKFCFFHEKSRQRRFAMSANRPRCWHLALELPLLEDANSIQVALMQVMRLLLSRRIEHKTAALLLYALQTASSNLRHTKFEPGPEQVVIDRCGVADTNLGDEAWYKEEFEDQEDEEASAAENEEESDDSEEPVDIEACADPAAVENVLREGKRFVSGRVEKRFVLGHAFSRAEKDCVKKSASAAGAMPSKPVNKAVISRRLSASLKRCPDTNPIPVSKLHIDARDREVPTLTSQQARR